MKSDFLDLFNRELRKSHHLKTLAERLIRITWSLSKYNDLLLSEYKEHTTESISLYGKEEHDRYSFKPIDQRRVFPELMMISEASSFLKIPVPTIHKLIRRSEIPFCRNNQILYFRRSELEKWSGKGKVDMIQ